MRKWKVPDWDNPYIRPINPAVRSERLGWYDATPGFAPRYRKVAVPVGAVVRVQDPHSRSDGWVGRITAHMVDQSGYTGLSSAECLNTGSVLNKRVGRVDQIEILHCRTLLPSADENN